MSRARNRSKATAAKRRPQIDTETLLQRDSQGFSGGLGELLRVVPDADGLRLIAALNERSRKRAAERARQTELLPSIGWRAGYAISAADRALDELGAAWAWTEAEDSNEARWLWRLRDGLDGFARAAWCFRFGYTYAGIAIVRRHLERWTYNLASCASVQSDDGEDDVAYIDRVWSVYPQMGSLQVGEKWATLSELLHGRPVRIGPIEAVLEPDLPLGSLARIHNYGLRAAEIALRQVRGAIHTSLTSAGVSSQKEVMLQAPLSMFPRGAVEPGFLYVFYEPLEYEFVMSDRARVYSSWGDTYRRIVESRRFAGLTISHSEAWMAVEERWARALDTARGAFEEEARIRGADMDPVVVHATVARYRCIAEMADIVAQEIDDPTHRSALRSASSALESAWVLWLQDLDDSLSCIRAVLEATARARAFRLKPAKASKLAARGVASTPHRWVEAAGWRRLAPLVRALGEFSHMRERSRHASSREFLTAVQIDAHPDFEVYTGRGSALREIASMFAHEVASTLHTLDAGLAATFRDVALGSGSEAPEEALAAWLNRVMAFRDYEFGEPEFQFSAS